MFFLRHLLPSHLQFHTYVHRVLAFIWILDLSRATSLIISSLKYNFARFICIISNAGISSGLRLPACAHHCLADGRCAGREEQGEFLVKYTGYTIASFVE